MEQRSNIYGLEDTTNSQKDLQKNCNNYMGTILLGGAL